ncbi:FAD/NAD(P)-binding domain-containing protein [Byssothecium circinans]|uniref:FAD/NAD(P)-binding domain-containing protein n=1 Tax=Byssothecium circinans TaxID=147558 RepID=A0A6A5TS80_9PLEO|nr:FAD/NAD(P)-binding domain-containing protein [Byssothecium circinans]
MLSGTGVSNGGGMDGELQVLVIGSGSTGLALAQGLRKAGIKCTVFERRPQDAQERDWNMGLHWGAPVLKSLMPDEWWSKIQSIQVDPHEPTKETDFLPFLKGDTGVPVLSIPASHFYRLRRGKLRNLLSQNLNVQYNKRLTNFTPSPDGKTITAHFEDGTSATGNLLVGADGARSTTRRLLLGPQKGSVTRLPYAATFIQSQFTAPQALFLRSFHPLFIASAHPTNKFAFFGMHDASSSDPSSWTFFFYISWATSLEEQEATKHWTDAQRVAQQKEFAKGFCDPWKSALEWAPDDARAWYMGLTDWDPGREGMRWDNQGGRVTLVGDACHPMTYQRGQGLNHSITDAGLLRDALIKIRDGGEQAELMTVFEDEMIERAGQEVRESTENTRMLHDWEKVRQSPVFAKGLKREG